MDSAIQYIGSGTYAILPPQDYHSYWRFHDIDTKQLDVHTPRELLDMLVDISPDISRAVWDFQRLCNPGYEVRAYELGSEKIESAAGKQHLDNFFSTLRDLYGSVDVVLGRFFIGAFLRGAFCSELVLDGEARESIDLVAPDPFSIRFRKKEDALRGQVWQPGQMQGDRFVPLDIPTFRYLPVDPVPASPYGRSLAAPSLFTTLFLLGILHDVKRVVMQQGYKRMDIVLNTEQAMDSFSYDPQGFATLGEYIRAAIEQVKSVYQTLQPDDAFFHTDLFTLSVPVGTIDSDSIGAIGELIDRLEKRIARGLKTNGLLMDMDTKPSESDSNRRWEIHAAGIKSLQHLCENMLESQLNVSLRAKGIPARASFRFSELRAAEMLRDEQTMAMRIQNARAIYAAGFGSQDEASNYAVNHNADQQEPRERLGKMELVQDNSDGQERLDQDSDDRGLRWPKKSELQTNGNH